jgi:hypothetical protein
MYLRSKFLYNLLKIPQVQALMLCTPALLSISRIKVQNTECAAGILVRSRIERDIRLQMLQPCFLTDF